MAKFDFQLEGVLRYRKNREQERHRELAVAQAHMARLQSELLALDQSVKDANENMRRNHLTGRIDLGMLASHRRFLGATQQKALELMQKMELARRNVDDARRVLAIAAKDRKVMEKLRERQFNRWAEEIRRKETAELDEIGMQLGFANLHDVEDRT